MNGETAQEAKNIIGTIFATLAGTAFFIGSGIFAGVAAGLAGLMAIYFGGGYLLGYDFEKLVGFAFDGIGETAKNVRDYMDLLVEEDDKQLEILRETRRMFAKRENSNIRVYEQGFTGIDIGDSVEILNLDETFIHNDETNTIFNLDTFLEENGDYTITVKNIDSIHDTGSEVELTIMMENGVKKDFMTKLSNVDKLDQFKTKISHDETSYNHLMRNGYRMIGNGIWLQPIDAMDGKINIKDGEEYKLGKEHQYNLHIEAYDTRTRRIMEDSVREQLDAHFINNPELNLVSDGSDHFSGVHVDRPHHNNLYYSVGTEETEETEEKGKGSSKTVQRGGGYTNKQKPLKLRTRLQARNYIDKPEFTEIDKEGGKEEQYVDITFENRTARWKILEHEHVYYYLLVNEDELDTYHIIVRNPYEFMYLLSRIELRQQRITQLYKKKMHNIKFKRQVLLERAQLFGKNNNFVTQLGEFTKHLEELDLNYELALKKNRVVLENYRSN